MVTTFIMELIDVDILFTRRGDEQVVVTISVVLTKTLARQLAEATRLYETRLGESVPTTQEPEKRFQNVQEKVA